MTVTRLIARPLIATGFVFGAVSALQNTGSVAQRAKPVTDKLVPLIQRTMPGVPVPTDPQTIVRINSATQIMAALALATGRAPRVSSTVLALSLLPTTVAGHAFWKETDAAAKKTQRLQFAKNLTMLGGVLLAAVDTEGKPGVAWRAGRAAKDVRREAKRLGHNTARETKLRARSVR
ncbi:MAG: DoxX family membrane protein [Marmoricola sp.]